MGVEVGGGAPGTRAMTASPKSGRYAATGSEAEFESGSRGRVLRNRLGITSVRAIQREESEALLAATQHLIDEVTVDYRFTADDICSMHRQWLGGITNKRVSIGASISRKGSSCSPQPRRCRA